MVNDLLEIASSLAARERGRPKQASLKRAVSTAYYAPFHELADLCSRELVGAPQQANWANYRQIYRALDHGSARRVLDPQKSEDEILPIALAFSTLQRERHTADYDPEFTLSRPDTIELIAQATRSIQALRGLVRSQRRSLAVRLITRAR